MIHNLHYGSCLDILPALPEESIDSCVSDPPYHLTANAQSKKGFMDQEWDGGSIAFDKGTWEAVYRVLKPGAHLAAMGGSRTYHRLACAIEDAGFEIRDGLAYLYGNGFPKSNHILKPAWEPIVIARKPFKGSIKANLERHGTGGMNIEDARIPVADGDSVAEFEGKGKFSPRPLDNKDYRTKQISSRSNTEEGVALGRWPANVVHDGSDEVIDEFPRAASRFFYTTKATIREREAGCSYSRKNQGERINVHPTVKPIELFRWIVRLLTPHDGIVLDPFLGSGTTAIAAILEGRGFHGIERDEAYADIAASRIEWWMNAINEKGIGRSVADILNQHE